MCAQNICQNSYFVHRKPKRKCPSVEQKYQNSKTRNKISGYGILQIFRVNFGIQGPNFDFQKFTSEVKWQEAAKPRVDLRCVPDGANIFSGWAEQISCDTFLAPHLHFQIHCFSQISSKTGQVPFRFGWTVARHKRFGFTAKQTHMSPPCTEWDFSEVQTSKYTNLCVSQKYT